MYIRVPLMIEQCPMRPGTLVPIVRDVSQYQSVAMSPLMLSTVRPSWTDRPSQPPKKKILSSATLYAAVCPDRPTGGVPAIIGRSHSHLMVSRTHTSDSCPLWFCPPKTTIFRPLTSVAVCPARGAIMPPNWATVLSVHSRSAHVHELMSRT